MAVTVNFGQKTFLQTPKKGHIDNVKRIKAGLIREYLTTNKKLDIVKQVSKNKHLNKSIKKYHGSMILIDVINLKIPTKLKEAICNTLKKNPFIYLLIIVQVRKIVLQNQLLFFKEAYILLQKTLPKEAAMIRYNIHFRPLTVL